MPGRIITLQRQVRELGRLRAGWSEPVPGKRPRPVKSKTWVVTSPSKDYIDAAAEAWGGKPEPWKPQGSGAEQWRVITEASAIDALLPPGDPVSQAYEFWTRGGCQRRCDGEVEQIAKQPCWCRQQFKDEFYKQSAEVVCKPTTRLGLIVPELPDLGIWRMESHGFYAANEITAMVDLIKSRVDQSLVIPVTLRIEPRTRVAEGKTKQFMVVTVGLRGASAQQILAGAVPALELGGAPERLALESGGQRTDGTPATGAPAAATTLTAEDALKQIGMARNQKQLDMLKDDFSAAGLRDQRVVDAWMARSKELAAARPTSAPPAPPAQQSVEVVDGEPEPDVTAVWMQVLALAGAAPRRWSADDLEKRVTARFSRSSDEIDGWQAQTFLDELKNGSIQ